MGELVDPTDLKFVAVRRADSSSARCTIRSGVEKAAV